MDTHGLRKLFDTRGGSEYGGEAVTQLEHALQAAELAEKEQVSAELIVAALLHDVGHLLHELPDDAPDQGVDDHHENAANNCLKNIFPPSVTEPIRMHVEAKRYLCATESDYLAQLSQPSVVSLNLQGGPMSAIEVADFEANPFAADAVKLRRWDDTAKVADLETRSLDHYWKYVEQVATQESEIGS